jgi:ketosteroid isomerase-like protein
MGAMASEHPNAQLVREGFAAFDRGDMEWMGQHLAENVVWHIGGNSKWSGTYEGQQQVLELFARQAQAMGGQPPSLDIHDVLGGDDHVVVLGTARGSAPNGQSAEWKFAQIFHIQDGKATEVWGMAENDAEVDPFLDSLEG